MIYKDAHDKKDFYQEMIEDFIQSDMICLPLTLAARFYPCY